LRAGSSNFGSQNVLGERSEGVGSSNVTWIWPSYKHPQHLRLFFGPFLELINPAVIRQTSAIGGRQELGTFGIKSLVRQRSTIESPIKKKKKKGR